MQLYVEDFGGDDASRVAVLLHGGGGSSANWFDLAPELVARGYKVLAPEARGHGRSPRANRYLEREMADDIVECVPSSPELVVGHSMGGRLLAHVVDRMLPGRAIYLDPAWYVAADRDIPASYPVDETGELISEDEFAARYPRMSREHVRVMLNNFKMWDQNIVNENRYAFADAETMNPPMPAPVPSLVLLADPTDMVTAEQQRTLPKFGYEIRIQRGAGHSLWKEDLPAMLNALDGWV